MKKIKMQIWSQKTFFTQLAIKINCLHNVYYRTACWLDMREGLALSANLKERVTDKNISLATILF
jgi:hypothetical protein